MTPVEERIARFGDSVAIEIRRPDRRAGDAEIRVEGSNSPFLYSAQRDVVNSRQRHRQIGEAVAVEVRSGERNRAAADTGDPSD